MRRRTRTVRVLGVDPSLAKTGLALPDGTTTDLSSRRDGWDRIAYILRELVDILDRHSPTHVSMEAAFILPKHIQGSMGLIELSGYMKLLFLSRGLPIVLVPPTTLKLYASGKGNANKEFVMKEIKRRWAKSFVSSDRADAFALQQFGIDYLTEATESVGEIRALGKAQLIEEPGLKSFAKFG